MFMHDEILRLVSVNGLLLPSRPSSVEGVVNTAADETPPPAVASSASCVNACSLLTVTH